MRFLITNIRNEDVVLGYPWLSTFEPQFDWTCYVATVHPPDLGE